MFTTKENAFFDRVCFAIWMQMTMSFLNGNWPYVTDTKSGCIRNIAFRAVYDQKHFTDEKMFGLNPTSKEKTNDRRTQTKT